MSKADIQDIIRNQIESNSVLLYMKGSPEAPECGFSAQAVAALKALRMMSWISALLMVFLRS